MTQETSNTSSNSTLLVTPASTPILSRIAKLSNLTLNSGTLTPSFQNASKNYFTVVNGVTSVNVTPTTFDPSSTVTVNGTTVTSGQPVNINLSTGNNIITIVVTK